jgi:NADH dehydrogenase FAD-containing subunit
LTSPLRGALADARNEQGYIRVDGQLRVTGQDRVYAIGDISDADANMAGVAGRQAEFLAGNLRTLITGDGEPATYQPAGTIIVIPLGPDGGAGQLPWIEGVAGPEVISALKGGDMGAAKLSAQFDAPVGASGPDHHGPATR